MIDHDKGEVYCEVCGKPATHGLADRIVRDRRNRGHVRLEGRLHWRCDRHPHNLRSTRKRLVWCEARPERPRKTYQPE